MDNILHFPQSAIQSWERFYRANFINCLSGFKSATLIGTLKESAVPNLGLFSNVVHIGADPAIIGFINRPREAAPHTIANIERTGSYTMNLVPAALTSQAHQSSAKYDMETNEFEAADCTALWRNGFSAPFVAESPVQYAMELLEIVPIRHNGTFLVLGRLTDAWVPQEILAEDGFLHLEKAAIIATLGIDGYYSTGLHSRYRYAKPGQTAQNI